VIENREDRPEATRRRPCEYRGVMIRSRPALTCFVVLPPWSVESSSDVGPNVDSDDVFGRIERVALDAGLICVRAEVASSGEFVENAMLERLLIADLVIADVTSENPSVNYMIGVRDGVNSRPTILIAARSHEGETISVPGTSDVVWYSVGRDGVVDPEADDGVHDVLSQRVHQAIDGDLPHGIPLLDATGWAVGGRLEHDKTDVFLERISTTEIGRRIRTALTLRDRDASVEALQDIESELLTPARNTPDLDTGLLGVYIGYRECAAYEHMVDLFPRMPPELRSTPVVREQLALALNRLAEASDQDGGSSVGHVLRTSALASLDTLDSRVVTAETLAIRGRIYKGWFHAAVASGDDTEARDMIDKAIETYEDALRADMRDYFPGINAITLRLTRGTPEDVDVAANLVPVVRMAVENAPEAHSEQERYWQIATSLELACAGRDWAAAIREIESLVSLDVGHWMHETTIDNLNLYRGLFDQDIDAAEHLDGVIEHLKR